MKALMLTILFAASLFAQNIVELKQPKSNKVIIKLRFANGSVSDPKGFEGLTASTANLITQGGTKTYTYSEIQDMLYPWAAGYYAQVDKEVSTFTFMVHVDFLDKFYPVMKELMLNPAFAEADFQRVMKNQQNYVDQVIRASSDEEYSKKALEDLLFRGTNYQHMVQGKSESVKAITLENIRQHYANVFAKNNLTIGIVGNYSPAFLKQLKNGYGDNSPRRNSFSRPPAKRTRRTVCRWRSLRKRMRSVPPSSPGHRWRSPAHRRILPH
jgi:zinc protease